MSVYFAGFIPTGGVYAAIFPDLPGCNCEGETLEAACALAVEAVHGHIVALVDNGDAVPEPCAQEAALAKLREHYAGLGLGDLPEGLEIHAVPAPKLASLTVLGMC